VTILLDTNIMIDALRRRQNRRAELASLVRTSHTLATSAINVGELYAGVRTGEMADLAEFLVSLECLSVTADIARTAGLLKNSQEKIGRTLALPDMIVAATALEHSLALMTDNRKDFPFPELVFFPE
jgi:predicted nucleic acid-binding protein